MLELLNRKEFIIFSTRDFASQAGLSMSAASKKLTRLTENRLLDKITKGIWANTRHPWFSPLACVPHLLGKEQGYVSFLTALHLHGLMSQIPTTIQIASTGHPRKLKTAIGTFEFMQLKPELMQQGIDWSDTQLPYLLADREKALLDTLYIATRKTRRFASLPEVELEPGGFNRRRFTLMLKSLPYPDTIRKAIQSRAETILLTAE